MTSHAISLPTRERLVAMLFADGQTVPQICSQLFITPNTARSQLRRTRNRYAAVGRSVGTRFDLRERLCEDGMLPYETWSRSPRVASRKHGISTVTATS
jgi:two-component system, NarL family, nitrate/nitrite response regulator NarL